MVGARLVGSLVAVALVPAAHAGYGSYNGSQYQYAQVVTSNPIYETVSYTVPVQECRQETVAYHDTPRARSATVPIGGAIIGGAIGNAVGHKKRNKQVGAVVGAVLGGSIGADIARQRREAHAPVRYGTEEVCHTVNERRVEEQLAGYAVTYRYGGETYTTTMDRDPGSTLRVRVQVTPLG